MSTRAVLAVGLAVVLTLASVGPVAGVAGTPAASTDDGVVHRPGADSTVHRTGDAAAQYKGDMVAQYKVSLDNVTIRTWLLRNATVHNATVQRVVVRNVTTSDGGRTNVTLSNVTVGTFDLDRAKLTNVTATKLVIRNKSVLSVPGGELIDPNIENRTIERRWTRNATISGVVIDRIAIDAATLCENASLGAQTNDAAAFDPRSDDDKPDVAVQNGTVERALIMRGEASNWSVGSVNQSGTTNASLPKACNRG